jgi:hypothetical protein
MAVAAADGGDAAAAERMVADGRRLAEEHHLQSLPPFARLLLGAGRAALLRGAWAPAASNLEQAIDLLRLTPLPHELSDALLALAQVRHAAGATGDARAALSEGQELIAGLDEPGLLARRLQETEERLAGRAAAAAPEELSARSRTTRSTATSGRSTASSGPRRAPRQSSGPGPSACFPRTSQTPARATGPA